MCRAREVAGQEGEQLSHPPGEGKLYAGSTVSEKKVDGGGQDQRQQSEPEQADPEFVADYLQKLRVAERSADASPDGR